MNDIIKEEISGSLEVFKEMLRDENIHNAIRSIAEACIAAFRNAERFYWRVMEEARPMPNTWPASS